MPRSFNSWSARVGLGGERPNFDRYRPKTSIAPSAAANLTRSPMSAALPPLAVLQNQVQLGILFHTG